MPTVLIFRYSDDSREGRELAVALIEATRGFDGFTLRRDAPTLEIAAAAIVVRARHVLSAALRAADLGDAYMAASMLRSLTESLFTLRWLQLDPELTVPVWRMDELSTRLTMHAEVRRVESLARRRARARGEAVDVLAPGGTLGPLDRSAVRRFKAAKSQLAAEANGLPRLAARKKRLRIESNLRLPSIRNRAQAAPKGDLRLGDIYSFAYRFDSNATTHVGIMSLQRFLEEDGASVRLRSTPCGSFPDPYVVGSRLMLELVAVAANTIDPVMSVEVV